MKSVLEFILIFCLSLKVSIGCCCSFETRTSKIVKKIELGISKDKITFNGKEFSKVSESVSKTIVSTKYHKCRVFQIDCILFDIILCNNSYVIPNFNKFFVNLTSKPYILAAVKTNNNNCYIVYCEDANFVDYPISLFGEKDTLKIIKIIKSGKIVNCRCMFYGCSAEYIDLNGIDASKITDMAHMFNSCKNLKYINLINFNAPNVIDIKGMFKNCVNLKHVNFNNFNAPKINNMRSMFSGCTNLESLDLRSFDTSKVVSTSFMFSGCTKLKYVDLSSFVTSNVTDMSAMFSECTSFESLDLRNFDTSNVTDMSNMFGGCRNLKYLDIIISDICKNKYIFSGIIDKYDYDEANITLTKKNKVLL